MVVAEELALIVDGPVRVGGQEQVLPFVTVDESGFPHVALLSRAELAVTPDRSAVLAVVAGPGTRRNLRDRRTATLIAARDTTVHTVKLSLTALHEDDGLLGGVFEVAAHKRDSLGIEITPMSFPATEALARLERWDAHARMLALLAQLAEASSSGPSSPGLSSSGTSSP